VFRRWSRSWNRLPLWAKWCSRKAKQAKHR
jgi:hypothetical protein